MLAISGFKETPSSIIRCGNKNVSSYLICQGCFRGLYLNCHSTTECDTFYKTQGFLGDLGAEPEPTPATHLGSQYGTLLNLKVSEEERITNVSRRPVQ